MDVCFKVFLFIPFIMNEWVLGIYMLKITVENVILLVSWLSHLVVNVIELCGCWKLWCRLLYYFWTIVVVERNKMNIKCKWVKLYGFISNCLLLVIDFEHKLFLIWFVVGADLENLKGSFGFGAVLFDLADWEAILGSWE